MQTDNEFFFPKELVRVFSRHNTSKESVCVCVSIYIYIYIYISPWVLLRKDDDSITFDGDGLVINLP